MSAEVQPIGIVVLPDRQRFPKRLDAVTQRQHRHAGRPKSISRLRSRRLHYAAERTRERRRTTELFFGQQEVSVQINVVFIKPPPPGKTEWIDRVNEDDGCVIRQPPLRRKLLQKRRLNRGAEKPFDAVYTARQNDRRPWLCSACHRDIDRERL